MNIKKQRMLFSILLGGCLLLLSSLVLQNKLEKELTIQQKRNIYMSGKMKKIQPWKVIISQEIPSVLKDTIKYNVPELLYLTQPNWSKRVKNIKIEIGVGNFDSSKSNGSPTNCNIRIDVPGKDYFTEDESKEFNFIILHEIAHCFISKQVLTRETMNWVDLSVEKKNEVNILFNKQEELFLQTYCKICEEKYEIPSPSIVYHELMADSIAAAWLLLLNHSNEDLEIIYKKRALDFIRNPLKSSHPSHFVLEYIENEFKLNNRLPYNVIIKITQKALIQYLQEMAFHYDKLKQDIKIEKEVGL